VASRRRRTDCGRDILLAELTGAHIHCQHISAAGSVELLRAAKQRGLPITGEACPHHFTLTDAAIAGSEAFWREDGKGVFGYDNPDAPKPEWPKYDTNFKMNPPLRSAQDREAILRGWLMARWSAGQRPCPALRL